MSVISTIVDLGDLFDVVWISAIAGVGVTAAYATALLGATRAVDHRREGRVVAAVAYGVLGAVAVAIVAASIAFGIVAMTEK